jgi:hypothetical protein
MSMEYCEKCDQFIDTDFNAEHFADDVNGCETTFEEKRTVSFFGLAFQLKYWLADHEEQIKEQLLIH